MAFESILTTVVWCVQIALAFCVLLTIIVIASIPFVEDVQKEKALFGGCAIVVILLTLMFALQCAAHSFGVA